MKNAPIQTTNESADGTASFTTGKLAGTDNPRHLRAIPALLTRSQRREHLDTVAGCSNSPDLVTELRRRGLDIPCDRVPDFDRDGQPIRRGVYHLLKSDRRKGRSMNRAKLESMRIMALLPPDPAPLAALVCLLLWWCL